MTNVVLSKHACERLKERAGLGKKAARRMACRAYDCGIDSKFTKSTLRKWLSKRESPGMVVKIYGEFVYVYEESHKVLITVIPIRNSLKKNRAKMIVQAA